VNGRNRTDGQRFRQLCLDAGALEVAAYMDYMDRYSYRMGDYGGYGGYGRGMMGGYGMGGMGYGGYGRGMMGGYGGRYDVGSVAQQTSRPGLMAGVY